MLLAEASGPSVIAHAWTATGRTPGEPGFEIAALAPLCVSTDRVEARTIMGQLIGGWLDEGVVRAQHPYHAEMTERWRRDGADGLATMPDDWWTDLAPAGTLDDACAFIDGMDAAAVSRVLLFPAPELGLARAQIDDVIARPRR